MNRARFRSGSTIHCILHHWPHQREPQAKPYPRPMPDHSRLLALLCPLRGNLPTHRLPTITWAEILPRIA